MEAPENCSVKVAVHIRPLISDERLHGCKECVTVSPGKPQVLFVSIYIYIYIFFFFFLLKKPKTTISLYLFMHCLYWFCVTA